MTAFVRLLLLCLTLLVPAGVALAQTPVQTNAQTEPLRGEIDSIEKTLERRQQLSSDELTSLRDRLDPVGAALDKLDRDTDQRLQTESARLQQLGGAKLPDNAPPETPEAKQEREAQAKTVAELDARLKQVRLLQKRLEQTVDLINDRRRSLFTAQLLERSGSVLDPRFWINAAQGLGRTWIAVQLLASDSYYHIAGDVGIGALAGAFAVIAVGGFALRFLYRLLLRVTALASAQAGGGELRHLMRALMVMLRLTVPVPAGFALVAAAIHAFDLVVPRALPVVDISVLAALIACLSRGVMAGAFAPLRPDDRIIHVDNDMAAAIYSAARDAGLVFAIGLMAMGINAMLVTPVALTAATTAVVASGLAAVALIWLARTTREVGEDAEPAATNLGWLRPIMWLIVAAIVVSLSLGYVALAVFLAMRLFAAFVIITLTLMLITLSDSVIGLWFGAGTHRGRLMAGALGVKADRVELLGALLAGVLRVVLLLLCVILIFAPWGLQSSDVSARLDDAVFGLKLVDLRVSAGNVVAALVTVLIGALAFRAAKSWLDTRILPHTGMDAGLQNSVSTILGYVGIVVVGAVGLRQLGLDLSNLAIVAGALSLGVGFGLQSIVSNFVSGLILLAERPIRVGDSINVKGEEGTVKRISVRSTEIETYERATVIVPNSELITGFVKNWTHPNIWSRIVVPVRVAYDSDDALVQSEMLAVAAEHPLVLKKPAPSVMLLKFGDTGLEFELRVICSDVSKALGVKSDIHFAILRRFRENGIIISPPIQRIQTLPTEQETHLFPNMPNASSADQA